MFDVTRTSTLGVSPFATRNAFVRVCINVPRGVSAGKSLGGGGTHFTHVKGPLRGV